jgi:hypothetical protein
VFLLHATALAADVFPVGHVYDFDMFSRVLLDLLSNRCIQADWLDIAQGRID